MTTDDNAVADSSALALYGVSDELIGMFDSLRETPGMAGNKFRLDDVNALAQSIICRNYGKACLELSYLLFAVMQRPSIASSSRHSPLLDFFWLAESITPRRFRLAFADETPVLNMAKDFLHIHIDKSEFAISPTRVGYLAVLFELLVNISPNIVQTAETQLATANLSQLKAYSSELQKCLYGYLNDHLAPAQQQRRFRFLSTWLKERLKEQLKEQNNQQLLADGVDDEAVLAFWQQMALAQDDGLGFRRYRTVVENFVSLLQALELGNCQRAVEYAAAIGYDTEQGEIHPEQLDELLGTNDEINVNWLADQPKFLSKQQLLWLEPIMSAGNTIVNLPLSIVRMRLFGDWQAELLQAVRGGDHNTIKAKLAKEDDDWYQHFQQEGQALISALANVRLAIVHILVELRQTGALQPMAQLLRQDEWAKIKQNLLAIRQEILTDGQHEDAAGQALVEQITTLFFSRLAQYCLQHPPVNLLLQQARAAFKANNRQGFKQLPAADSLTAYELGFDTLGSCQGQLKQLLQRFDGLFSSTEQWQQKSAADLVIFNSVFEKMYKV